MTRTETIRCWLYGLLAVIALVGTQWNLGAFIGTENNGGVSGFLDDVVDGPAATFTTIDLLVVAAVVTIFMVVEGRRLRLPWSWAYVALVFLVAVSVAFPLFLIARTRLLAEERIRAEALQS